MIEVSIKDKDVVLLEQSTMTSNSQNIDSVRCVFDSSWQSYGITALFRAGSLEMPATIVNGIVRIPSEVLKKNSLLFLSFLGINGADVKATKYACIGMVEEGAGLNAIGALPSPTIYEQWVNDIKAYAENAEQSLSGAMSCKAEAEKYMNHAFGSKNEAYESARTCETYKESANESNKEAANQAKMARESADIAANNMLNGVSRHNTDASSHPSIISDIRSVEAIARGKANANVFGTYEAMTAWLKVPQNTEKLNIGDNLYIRDTGVKDYWWDGAKPQELEAEAPDLTDYYTKDQIEAMLPVVVSESEYEAMMQSGHITAGRIYYVV